MAAKRALKFDEIGYWSEVKLAIVKEYAAAYSNILTAQEKPKLHHVYVDAFAGAGAHVSKTTGVMVPGSPLNALAIQPPFKEHHLIDLDGAKVANLRRGGERTDVHVHQGDCNDILLKTVLPRIRYEDYRRGRACSTLTGSRSDGKLSNEQERCGRSRFHQLPHHGYESECVMVRRGGRCQGGR